MEPFDPQLQPLPEVRQASASRRPTAGIKPETMLRQLLAGGTGVASFLAEQALASPRLRGPFLKKLEQYAVARAHANNRPGCPARVRQDQADLVGAAFASVERALDRGRVVRPVLHRLVRALLANAVLRANARAREAAARFTARHEGAHPPIFLVLSPTGACNLRCTGCYAGSERPSHQLEWPTLDRIVAEAKDLWGIRFFTISGGEPLLYRSQGRRLLDLAERHSDCFFQMYTNGCLIDRPTADAIARAGNLIPAISVEGLEARTDARRGRGVFRAILGAMGVLRAAGVPYGISITATRHNAEEVLSDEFLDFWFGEQQAVFGWLFQYMPIGRSYTVDLMVTPEQRLWMWRRTWQIIRERRIFLADFWNCGTVTEGCIAAGTSYLYIDWHGKVMPCVFVPYAACDIHEIYDRGGTLDDVYDLPYFRAIRRWQSDYAAGDGRPLRRGNWLIPCSLRDHYAAGRELICRYGPEPEDRSAADALGDPEYAERMHAYDTELERLFDPVWEDEYIAEDKDRSQVAAAGGGY